MELAEQRAPNGFKRIEDVIPHGELAHIARAYKVAAGFDPEELNSRPSLSLPYPTDARPATAPRPSWPDRRC
jgi:hypothetical protein